jgi:DNA-binding NarL/FixJ family response regulator
VEAGELSPIVVGDVYCSVIAGCLEAFDLRRAREWTTQMNRWCESQADLVAYSGQCLVRRAQILELHGAWSEAGHAAQQACERCLQGPDQAASGAAWYQRGELHRLRGEFAEAEEAYRQASRRGRVPHPGFALLRLAQGQAAAAATAIRQAVDEAREGPTRARLLPAHVEIMLAVGDLTAARIASDELAALSSEQDAPLLRAAADEARGAVLLSEGDPQAALLALRQAWVSWQEIEAPYPAARVRVLISGAHRRLGDRDAAEMELDAARWVFLELGATVDLDRVEALSRGAAGEAGGLSRRERQVLRLIATGKTNRAIAEELFISERTVERHVSNIFVKLDLPSRAAATAYAYQHQLV